MRDRVAISIEKFARLRDVSIAFVAVATLVACSNHAPREPIDIVTSESALDGSTPATWTRSLQPGVYLVEVRERDVDARVVVSTAGRTSTLENSLPRNGAVYRVVSLDAAAELRVTATSADHPGKRG